MKLDILALLWYWKPTSFTDYSAANWNTIPSGTNTYKASKTLKHEAFIYLFFKLVFSEPKGTKQLQIYQTKQLRFHTQFKNIS